MIKILTNEYLDGLVELTKEFHNVSGYTTEWNELYITRALVNSMSKPNHLNLIMVDDLGRVVGMLLAVCVEHPFYPINTASELAWYVKPDYRGKESMQLLKAYEYWATQLMNAHIITMVSLENVEPEKVDKLYKHMGYKLKEHSYVKEL